jgi:hypothetical protein
LHKSESQYEKIRVVKTGVGWWQALEVVRKVGAKLSIPTGKILASKHAFSTLNPVVY